MNKRLLQMAQNREKLIAAGRAAFARHGFAGASMEELTAALRHAIEDQGRGITTLIEALINQELGEPFRRDAMKKPVAIAGISAADMRPQARA